MLNRRKLVNNRLVYEDGKYSIDFEDFERKIVDEKVKLYTVQPAQSGRACMD